MPTLARSNRGPGGFTLVEMLVVLAVLSLVAMVAAQRIGRKPAALAWQEGGARLAAAVHGARREAARSGAMRVLDPGALVPGAVLQPSLPAAGARSGAILVYPDGSSNGGTILVGGRALATIDWLTSEVHDAP
jgi:prepilin-type N-terminal cleavage/methylation domain-containing protein